MCTVNPLAVSEAVSYLTKVQWCLKRSRDWECVSASKFAKIAAVSPVYLALVEQVGDLNFTHRSAHGGQGA